MSLPQTDTDSACSSSCPRGHSGPSLPSCSGAGWFSSCAGLGGSSSLWPEFNTFPSVNLRFVSSYFSNCQVLLTENATILVYQPFPPTFCQVIVVLSRQLFQKIQVFWCCRIYKCSEKTFCLLSGLHIINFQDILARFKK